jgi:hypothetical protein
MACRMSTPILGASEGPRTTAKCLSGEPLAGARGLRKPATSPLPECSVAEPALGVMAVTPFPVPSNYCLVVSLLLVRSQGQSDCGAGGQVLRF